jgi:uncharacterized membrane protein YeaQ/YmgE (transglycosylase-associated protein family)
MSYMFVVIIGAVAGWVAGRYVKGSEHGIGVDFAAGAIGAGVAVLLSRLAGPAAASGLFVSLIVSILGAVAGLYGMRRVIKATQVPPPPRPRRRRL